MRLQRPVICLCLALAAFAPASARGEWYDYYDDGLRLLDKGEAADAVLLLEQALRRKELSGYFRTYGNNYVWYLPHFWLGVAHHHAGECESSLASFERSAQLETLEESLIARMASLRAECEAQLAPPPAESPAPALAEAPEPAPLPVGSSIDPARLESGLTAYLAGDFEGAGAIFAELAGVTPGSAQLQLLLGMALHGAWVAGDESDDALIERSRGALAEASRISPALVPDPALCPPSVVALYRSLRR